MHVGAEFLVSSNVYRGRAAQVSAERVNSHTDTTGKMALSEMLTHPFVPAARRAARARALGCSVRSECVAASRSASASGRKLPTFCPSSSCTCHTRIPGARTRILATSALSRRRLSACAKRPSSAVSYLINPLTSSFVARARSCLSHDRRIDSLRASVPRIHQV